MRRPVVIILPKFWRFARTRRRHLWSRVAEILAVITCFVPSLEDTIMWDFSTGSVNRVNVNPYVGVWPDYSPVGIRWYVAGLVKAS